MQFLYREHFSCFNEIRATFNVFKTVDQAARRTDPGWNQIHLNLHPRTWSWYGSGYGALSNPSPYLRLAALSGGQLGCSLGRSRPLGTPAPRTAPAQKVLWKMPQIWRNFKKLKKVPKGVWSRIEPWWSCTTPHTSQWAMPHPSNGLRRNPLKIVWHYP